MFTFTILLNFKKEINFKKNNIYRIFLLIIFNLIFINIRFNYKYQYLGIENASFNI